MRLANNEITRQDKFKNQLIANNKYDQKSVSKLKKKILTERIWNQIKLEFINVYFIRKDMRTVNNGFR